MSDELQWLIGITLPVVLALTAVVWTMLRAWIARNEKGHAESLAALRAEVARLEARFGQWIETKERLDHKFRHDEYSSAIQRINLELYPLTKQVEILDAELEKLREWKHLRADPYIGAMDAMRQQIDRLETRMNSYLKRGAER